MAPGIQLNENNSQMKDSLGQQYTTPEMSILDHKCDIVIVGRGIIKHENPVEAAIKYQKLAYDSYLKRLEQN
jgi:uridine monophosphate synthetase